MNRYLLESERLVFAVRRHSAVLAGSFAVYLVLVSVAVLLLAFAGGSGVIATTGLVVLLGSSAWFGWKVGDWWVERFTVTDRRVLLVSGLLTRRVAIMPLRKVTDLTFERSVVGRLFGYGAFVMESAGQQQALSRIDFLPRPESLYLQMSDLLFGSGGADHDPDEDEFVANRRPVRSPRTPRPSRPRDPGRPTDQGATTRLGPPGTTGTGPRVTSRPPVAPPVRPAARPPARPAGAPSPPSATAPLPSIARDRPLARRPRGRLDRSTDEPERPQDEQEYRGRHGGMP